MKSVCAITIVILIALSGLLAVDNYEHRRTAKKLRLTIRDYAAHRDMLHELLQATRQPISRGSLYATVIEQVVGDHGSVGKVELPTEPLQLQLGDDGSYINSVYRASQPYTIHEY